MADVRPIEATAAVMLLAAIVWLGVYPAPVLRSMKPAVNMVVKRFETARGSDAAGLQPLTALAPKVGTLGGIDTPEEDDEQ
jgi:hypothetical protein